MEHCKHGMIDGNFLITVVYAKCTKNERRLLWAELERLAATDVVWLVGGTSILLENLVREWVGNLLILALLVSLTIA